MKKIIQSASVLWFAVPVILTLLALHVSTSAIPRLVPAAESTQQLLLSLRRVEAELPVLMDEVLVNGGDNSTDRPPQQPPGAAPHKQQHHSSSADDAGGVASLIRYDDEPWLNLTRQTVACYFTHFEEGYRNQMMVFTMIVMEALAPTSCGGHGCRQILHTTLQHRDKFGSGTFVPHAELFDVEHWNSHYPQLPRLVSCDPSQMTDYDCGAAIRSRNISMQMGRRRRRVKQVDPRPSWNSARHSTRPYYIGRRLVHYFMKVFRTYNERQGPFAQHQFPNPAHLLMMRGAIRPHPDLMKVIEKFKRGDHVLARGPRATTLRLPQQRQQQQQQQQQFPPYMALHARVEPDMQRHYVLVHDRCKPLKVIRLHDIISLVYAKWPNKPPGNVSHVFIPINRKVLELEGRLDHQVAEPSPFHHPTDPTNTTTNWVAIENLQLLNQLVAEGMWNGTVPVFEAGVGALTGTRYERIPSISAAMVDFELAVGAAVFVGMEISSWSHDVVNTRFYRDSQSANYMYRPDGILQWTIPNETIHPPPFDCLP